MSIPSRPIPSIPKITPRKIEQLFLYLLQIDCDTDEIKEKIKYFNGTDWQQLYELSRKNGLFPAFYNSLLNLRLDNIPPEFLSTFKNLYLLNFKRNAIFEKKLFEITSAFRNSNIPVIPLKGPFLARYLYNDLSLRRASLDLDLLVRPEKIKAARDVLETLGYHTKGKNLEDSRRFRNETYLSKKVGDDIIIIDLHWNLRDVKFIHTHINEFWSDAREINIDGHQILFPSCEDLLLYLGLITIFEGGLIKIKSLYDIHILIMQFESTLNWGLLTAKTKRYNLDAVLFFALELSRNLFHTNLPREVLKTLKPGMLKEYLGKRWVDRSYRERLDYPTDSAWNWFVLMSIYLNSPNIFEAGIRIYKHVFKPMEELMWSRGQPSSKSSYRLYLKRLSEPITNIFRKN